MWSLALFDFICPDVFSIFPYQFSYKCRQVACLKVNFAHQIIFVMKWSQSIRRYVLIFTKIFLDLVSTRWHIHFLFNFVEQKNLILYSSVSNYKTYCTRSVWKFSGNFEYFKSRLQGFRAIWQLITGNLTAYV